MAGNRTLKLSILADVDDLNKKLKAANTDVETSSNKLADFGKVAGAAFLAAAAAAGAYAIKIGIDGVKAAIEDEKAQTQLAKALENATGATKAQIAATEESIDKMARSSGVADDKLRPALQRLSLSTNDIAKAQDLLAIALDISASTGKPLEGVANALGKAFDGQTTALGKLGIGLSSAELKTMTFDEVTKRLTDTFGGASAANAETYAGKIARVKVAFDEAKESLGAALLPILEKLLTFVTGSVLPVFEKLTGSVGSEGLGKSFVLVADIFTKYLTPVFKGVKSAFDSISDAISDNKASFTAYGKIIADYVAPVLGTVLGGALKVVGVIANGVIDIVGGIAGVIAKIVNGAIDGINALIKAYNAIPLLPNIPTIDKPTVTIPKVTGTNTDIKIPSIPTIKAPSSGGGGGGTVSTAVATASTATDAFAGLGVGATSGAQIVSGDYAARNAGVVNNITVNGAIDSESTARQIVEILNTSTARGGGGGIGAARTT